MKNVFRDAFAKFIRKQRRQKISNKKISSFVVAFCDGWLALSDEMDVVNEKYKTENLIKIIP